MKRKTINLVLLFAAAILFTSFSLPVSSVSGGIKGKVIPVNAGVKAMAVSGADTIRANVINGAFEINNLAPGTYEVLVVAAAPYKNSSVKSVKVMDGEITDIGSIPLSK